MTVIATFEGYSESYNATVEPYIYSKTSILQLTPGNSERINVSLYNGTVSDNQNYSWTIENPSVAELSENGQYCVVKANTEGYSRIKVTNTAAAYPYYIGVYVLQDFTSTTYITCKDNIKTVYVDQGSSTVSVDLVNPKSDTYKQKFSYQILDGDTDCVSILANNDECQITPLKAGQCTLRVTNEEADSNLPFDIIVRSVEIVDSAYIEPSQTVVNITDSTTEYQVTAKIAGLTEEKDYSTSDFVWEVEDDYYASYWTFGNQITLTGKHNGATSVYVSHPKCQKKRQILVICENQTADAVDASCYITTTQNYIKTKVGADETTLQVSLRGGSDGDERNFFWDILQQPDDGTSDVISVTTTNGNEYSSSRAAAQTFAYGTLYIKPLAEGTATITVSHPKSYYTTEILVKVLNEGAVLEDPLYFTGSGIVKFLNSETATYTVGLNGKNKTAADEADISWKSNSDGLVVNGNGTEAVLSSTSTGSLVRSMTISHPKTTAPKDVLVLTADTQEELDAIKAFYSDKTYYSVNAGKTAYIYVQSVGFTDSDGEELDFSEITGVSWTSSNPEIFTVEKEDGNPLCGEVTGVKAGKGTATIKYGDTSATFNVTVYPENVSLDEVETSVYFTTARNVIVIGEAGGTATASVTAVGLSSKENENIEWKSSDESVATVVGNGTSAQVTAVKEGQAVLTVSHPLSENTLKIYVKVGSEYVTDTTKPSSSGSTAAAVYIKSADVIGLVKGSADKELQATLANWSGTEPGFKFESTDSSVAQISSQSENGTAYIHAEAKGSCEISISSSQTKSVKKVLAVVANTEAELEEILKSSVYLSTSNNTVAFDAIGQSKKAVVTAANLDSSLYSLISWKSADESIAKVVGNGTSATIYSRGKGSTTIDVSYSGSLNSITFYVFVDTSDVVIVPSSDSDDSGSSSGGSGGSVKYITVNSDVIAMTKDSDVFTLKAYLANGTDDENLSGFSFEIEDESVAKFSAAYSSGTAYVKAVAAGQTEITVSHEKSSLKKKVLVVIANTAEELSAFKFLTTSQNVVTLAEGGSKSISVSITNASETVLDGYTWTTSNAAVAGISAATSSTAVIVGNGAGTAKITVTNSECKYPLEIIVQVVDASSAAVCPYIQATASVLELKVSDTFTTVTAELVGGSDTDAIDFEWTSDDSSVIEAYGQNGVGKVRAVAAGLTYLRVSHPKAPYDQLILCICSVQTTSECSISVSSGNIMSIKPDAGEQTITASLVNGSTSDKYNFTWSLDVYDVVDMTYSANTAIITPLKAGVAQLTIHHPKSPYDQTVVIKVQQYSDFAFGSKTKTVASGSTTYVSMEVPSASVSTTVVYEVDDPTVCTVQGTNAVCAITGKKAGATAVIHAKMMAGTTVYAETSVDLLVNVTAAAEETAYISGNSTIYTMDVGASRTFSATLVGTDHPETDVYSLQWETGDPSVLSLAGATQNADGKYVVTGSSCYGTAKASGETTLTISYSGIAINLVYHVIVAAEGEKDITLSKSYVTIEKNKSSEIKATIDGGDTADYKEITWEADKSNGNDIVCILGNNCQTVSVYGVSAGTTYIYATTSDGKMAKCQVVVSEAKTLSFVNSTVKVQPTRTRTVTYTMTPSDATLTWQIMDSSIEGKECFSITDLGITDSEKGTGQIQIEGIAETGSSVPVTFMNSYGKTVQLNIKVAWDYDFSLLQTPKITGKPVGTYKIGYTVCPNDAVFQDLDSWNCANVVENITEKTDDVRKGYFVITPKGETGVSGETHTITAVNPAFGNATVGEQSITLKFGYEDNDISIAASKYTSDGNFSKVSNAASTITLGDGETLKVNFAISNSAATKSYVKSAVFSKQGYDWSKDGSSNIWTLKETVPNDVIEEGYKITWAQTPKDKSIDWEDGFKWHFSKCGHSGSTDDLWLGLVPKAFNSETVCISSNYYGTSDQIKTEYDENARLITSFSYYALAFRQPFRYGYETEDSDGDTVTSYASVWNGGYTYDNAEKVYDWTLDKTSYPVEENKSLAGQFWSKQRFESCAWFYCPGTSVSYSDLESRGLVDKISSSGDEALQYQDGTYVTSSDSKYYKTSIPGRSTNRSADCIPAVNGGIYLKNLDRDGHRFCIKEQVFYKNVNATKTTSTDKNIVGGQKILGTCTVTVYNAFTGADVSRSYNIYFETRNCSKTQP